MHPSSFPSSTYHLSIYLLIFFLSSKYQDNSTSNHPYIYCFVYWSLNQYNFHPSINAFNLICIILQSIHNCINFFLDLFFLTYTASITVQSTYSSTPPPILSSIHWLHFLSIHPHMYLRFSPNHQSNYLLSTSLSNWLSNSHPLVHYSNNGCNPFLSLNLSMHAPLHSLHEPLGWAYQAWKAANNPEAQDGHVQQALSGSQTVPVQPEMEQAGQHECHGGTSYTARQTHQQGKLWHQVGQEEWRHKQAATDYQCRVGTSIVFTSRTWKRECQQGDSLSSPGHITINVLFFRTAPSITFSIHLYISSPLFYFSSFDITGVFLNCALSIYPFIFFSFF